MKRLGTILLLLILSASTAHAQLLNPAPQTPHFPHMNVFDFARGLFLNPPGSTQYKWMTDRIDAAESHGNWQTLRSYDPTIKLVNYQIDQSILQGRASGITNEDVFLHFADTTVLDYYDLPKTTYLGRITIPGCPVGTIKTSSCRVQTFLWHDWRYVFALGNTAARDWLRNDIVNNNLNAYSADAGPWEMTWFDEHSPGFTWGLSFGWQTICVSGCTVREYGAHVDNIGTAWGNDVAAWHASLYPYLAAAGKRGLLNVGAQLMNPDIAARARSLHGFDTESWWRPEYVNRTDFARTADIITEAIAPYSAWVSPYSTNCNPMDGTYSTAGNYSSARARYLMWRIVGYHVVREMPSDLGRVYFNPSFCSGQGGGIPVGQAQDQDDWLTAFQYDVGVPTGRYYVHQSGTSPLGSGYTIYGRQLTKGLALIRPKDCATCTQYGDNNIVQFTLPQPYRRVNDNGTLSAASTVWTLRNAEALLLVPERGPDTNPPAAPVGLRVM